jgi:acyl carrier protein
MEEEIRQLIQEALVEYQLPDVLETSFDLIELGKVDSLGMLSLATAIEKRFGIEVLDHEWTLLRSIQSIRQLIEKRRAPAAQAA